MSDITFPTQSAGSSYTHEMTNEIKTAVNSKVDKVAPTADTLTTGSNALDLTTLVGKEYAPYDMASGALTLTAAASPIRGGCAYGIIISNGSTIPNVAAFTVLSGEYDNTNDVENHFIVVRKLNASNVETNYLQWIQPV